MKKCELTKFASLITATAVIHNRDFPESAVELYWQSLKQFSYEQVEQALKAHRESPDGGQFMPQMN